MNTNTMDAMWKNMDESLGTKNLPMGISVRRKAIAFVCCGIMLLLWSGRAEAEPVSVIDSNYIITADWHGNTGWGLYAYLHYPNGTSTFLGWHVYPVVYEIKLTEKAQISRLRCQNGSGYYNRLMSLKLEAVDEVADTSEEVYNGDIGYGTDVNVDFSLSAYATKLKVTLLQTYNRMGFTIDKIYGQPARTLTILHSRTNTILVSWPQLGNGWRLEQANVLRGGSNSWLQVTSPYETNGGYISVTFTNSSPLQNHFFRLHRP